MMSMNVISELQHLEKAAKHVPRLLALRRAITRGQKNLLQYDRIVDGWYDNVITPQEQSLLNGVKSASGLNTESNSYRKLGKLNAYFDNTKDVLKSKKNAHILVGNVQSLISLTPIAALPFKEGLSTIVEHVTHANTSLDLITTIGLAGLSVLGVVVGLA